VVLLPPLLKLGQQVFLVANPIVKGNHLLGLRSVIIMPGNLWSEPEDGHTPIIAQSQVRAELWSAQPQPAWRRGSHLVGSFGMAVSQASGIPSQATPALAVSLILLSNRATPIEPPANLSHTDSSTDFWFGGIMTP
jgi:hypothetical protein